MGPTVFVCGACGKVGETRYTVGDESCATWAVECWRSSVELRSEFDRRAVRAVAATTDWVEPAPPPPPRVPPPVPTAAQRESRARRLERRAVRRSP
jgi:hypothetical protein